jgi:hypothetical protein
MILIDEIFPREDAPAILATELVGIGGRLAVWPIGVGLAFGDFPALSGPTNSALQLRVDDPAAGAAAATVRRWYLACCASN